MVCRVESSITSLWTGLFPTEEGLVNFFLLLISFVEIPAFNANSVDLDQMPHSAAFDLGLHCLPITLLGVSRLKWVNTVYWKNLFCLDLMTIVNPNSPL